MVSEHDAIELIRLHWERAFAAFGSYDRLTKRLSDTTTFEAAREIRQAQAELWGAIALLIAYHGGSGDFDPSAAGVGTRFNELLRLVGNTYEWLPAMPDGTDLESPVWKDFFLLVDAMQHDAIITVNSVCEELAAAHPGHDAKWWQTRATIYKNLTFIPPTTRI